MDVQIEKSWKSALSDEFGKEYFESLTKKVRSAYLEGTPVFPPPKEVFTAFSLCPFDAVKVVVLGQDPYHGRGQAHGLAFSVQEGIRVPPSLQNVYKELRDDVGKPIPETGDLTDWARQGVLLLNATLTVLSGKPGSHQGIGWETFTDAVIQTISDKKEHVVFLLWGRYAQNKDSLIDGEKHCILKAAHPSPFSAHSGFFGCKHFSKANAYLTEHGRKPIDW